MNARETATAIGGPRQRTARGWLVRCVAHSDHTPSLHLSDGPDGRLLVHCFAGCEQEAVLKALRPFSTGSVRAADSEPLPSREETDRERTEAAIAIWREARHDLEALTTYFRARGVEIPVPPSLRFHPALLHTPTDLHLPAMVAAVQASDRAITAVHRTYLTADLTRKAACSPPKMALGPMRDGAVRLAKATDMLGLAEGIETAQSAMQLSDVPCWAALGSRRLHAVTVPLTVREVHIFADNGQPGQEAAEKAADRFTREGKRVLLRFPPDTAGDWNDVIQQRTAA